MRGQRSGETECFHGERHLLQGVRKEEASEGSGFYSRKVFDVLTRVVLTDHHEKNHI